VGFPPFLLAIACSSRLIRQGRSAHATEPVRSWVFPSAGRAGHDFSIWDHTFWCLKLRGPIAWTRH
jgi:hypothetical protein